MSRALTRGEARSGVERILTDLLSLDDPVDWSVIRYQATPEWDSLVHMAIVTDIESEFGVTLTADDVMGMTSLQQILELLEGRGVGSA